MPGPSGEVGPAGLLEEEPPPPLDEEPLSLAAVADADDWYAGCAGVGTGSTACELDESSGTMKKCTLCVDRIYNTALPEAERQPACVLACPTHARFFGDLDDPASHVSRITAGKVTLHRERLDLADVAREVVERYAGASRSRIELRTVSAPGSWDRTRLEQVVTNLLANAIKYGDGKPIDVIVEPRDGGAAFIVRDRGIGIAPQDADRIFGRFERAISATAYGGLGLGLYIARQIVVAHGGRISVESTPGEGATFTVVLPPGDAG